MISKIFRILSEPYPLKTNWKQFLRAATLSGLFVMVFLFVLKPFGIRISQEHYLYFFGVCVGFGSITWVVYLVFYGLMHFFSTFFPALQEFNWKVWKEILATTLFVSVLAAANMLFNNYYFKQPSLFQDFWIWQAYTISLGIFPIVAGAFYTQNKTSKQYELQSNHINKALEKESSHPQILNHYLLTLKGENQNEKLSIQVAQLLYIHSTDNYIEVFYTENENIKNTLLRLSLTKASEQLSEFAQIYRCHRAYIVNLGQVVKLSGNAQGYKLHLVYGSVLVPVSRSLNKEIMLKLGNKTPSHSPQTLTK